MQKQKVYMFEDKLTTLNQVINAGCTKAWDWKILDRPKQTNQSHKHVNCILTLMDKMCHMVDLHQLRGDALLVEKQQSLQELLPA